MHVETVFVDTSWLHNVWEMFLRFIIFKFLWKNSVSGKIKAHLPRTPKHCNNCSAPTFLILFNIFLAPAPFKNKGRDYAFCMRDYKAEIRKLLPFYITDFLFTEPPSHDIWRKLKVMQNDIPNILHISFIRGLHISDPNLL